MLGNGRTVDSNGVSAEMIVAYQSIDPPDSLVVILRIQTHGVTASPFLYTSTYRSPDGAQRQATDAYGPTDLGVDSHATVSILFEQVEPGGQVTIEGCVHDCDGEFTITLEVG